MNLQFLHQPPAENLSRVVLLVVLCLGASGAVCADEPGVFTAPKAYPIDRYEAGWNKNPFTLKTAPTVVEQDSFAKDLAIGSYYGDAKDPTVVVVNVKTGERITLRKKQSAANGMQLKNIQLGASRKDIVAEVTLGAQTSEVRYNDDYLKQIAGAEAPRVQPGQPPGMPGQQRPGAPPPGGQQPRIPVPLPGTAQAAPRVTLPPLPQGNQGRAPVPTYGGQPANTAMAAANRTNGNVNPSVAVGNPTVNGGNSAASSGSVPMVSRRRLITPATGVQ
ncbi:MAG: hypothetical protein B7Z37_19780 [Verrucomicrobia bacterium 12-59-8]|nr:MAG: hypothetical protein B7Z37_19780 [Verrucomicrobia bacterium 12-59-8]